MKFGGASWWPVAAPLAFFASAATLTRLITDRPEEAAAMARGIAGPTTWPTFMLYGVMLFALAWAVQQVAHVLRQQEQGEMHMTEVPLKPVGPRIWLAIALVLAYGFGLPYLGFTLGTLIFIALWLWLGGIRSLWTISLVSLLGTTGLLYLFVKLALMPLDRGFGPIGEFTVALYRLLYIY